MMRCFTGKTSGTSKKGLGSKSTATSQTGRESFDKEPSTPLAYLQPSKHYLDDSSDQADLEVMRAFERERQEDLERSRIIEELARKEKEEEKEAAVAPTVTANLFTPPPYPNKRDPALHFVRELKRKPQHRYFSG